MAVELRAAFVETLMELVSRGTNLGVLVSDSTSTSKIKPFQEAYPERLINVGIAEQNLIGAAAGISLGGMIPITANATPFLVARSNEQVKTDICYSDTNVKMVGLNPGFAYGALGPTHHAIDDISIMRGFGGVRIFAPQDSREARMITEHAVTSIGPVYIRLDSGKFPDLPATEEPFVPGRPLLHRTGADLTLVALGTAVHDALSAAEGLASQGIEAGVVGISSVRPLDRSALADLLKDSAQIVTVEEHSVHGGVGSLIAELIAEELSGVRLRRLGVPEGEFAPASPREAIKTEYRLDAEGITAAVREILR